MERALNPDILRLALGKHDVLPSAEEVTGLIAQAELSMLLSKPQVDATLIETAWYLHAIASSKYALRIYGLNRQRAAFRIAGHIFDLATKIPELNQTDKLKFCFGSQIAYLRSELNPNAIAVYNQEVGSNLTPVSLFSEFTNISLYFGVAFLGFDVSYIYKTVKNIQAEIRQAIIDWDIDDIFSTPYGAAAGVALGTKDLMTFLVYGNRGALEKARHTLQKAIIAEPSTDDQISRWIAAHLLDLSSDLDKSSIWTLLPPDTPINLTKAFVMGRPKVLTFWPPQIELLKPSGPNDPSPLSSEVKRLFLSTPTSSGKTLLAQLIIASHLVKNRTSVYYVAPTRSLCREVRVSLESRLRFFGKEIVDGLPEGGWLREFPTSAPKVEVMTPERLSYLLRTDSTRVLNEVGLFIFDEVHNINDPERGWILEQDLAYLHYATNGNSQRIILISAAVGNQAHFVKWLEEGGNTAIHRASDWRGPRRIHTIYSTNVNWDTRTEIKRRSPTHPLRVIHPLFGQLDVRLSATGETSSIRTTKPIGQLALIVDTSGNRKKEDDHSTPFYKSLLPIIIHLAKAGSVLIIEGTRPQAARMARAIAKTQPLSSHYQLKGILDLVEARLGAKHPLWEVLQNGVAYHHSSLPSEIRVAIEEAVVNGHIKFLVATTTMGEGVNLPVRSVVIASQGSYSASGYNEYIKGSKLINIIGRAGRATKETEGIVVLALQSRPNTTDFERLDPKNDDTQVLSMLATEHALNELSHFEDIQRTTEDALFQIASNTVSNFLSFVWFIASELEKIDHEHLTIERISNVLSHTLAWVQLTDDHKNKWLELAELTLDRYRKTDENLRRRWSAAGTSVSSASKIEHISRSLANSITVDDLPKDTIRLIRYILADGRLDQILMLPEAPQRSVYAKRGGKHRTAIAISIEDVLIDWIQGAEIVELADKHLQLIKDIDYRFEQLGDLISQYFEGFFPWVFGTIVAWTNQFLEAEGVICVIPGILPAYVRWGVDNTTATELMLKGMTSRTLAMRIAKCWFTANAQQDVFTWLRQLSLTQWQQLFSASFAELRLLLEFCRDQKGGPAVELLTSGKTFIEAETELTKLSQDAASLRPIEDIELSSFGIWVNNELVGKIASRDQSDIQAILSSGLEYAATFSVESSIGTLQIELTSPEDY